MKEFDLTTDVKDEALAIATQRDRIAHELGRVTPRSSYPGRGMTTLEMNHLGAIAEVSMKKHYPSLDLGQPYVVYSKDTNASDFIYRDAGLEVKNHCWYRCIYDTYFINALRFDLKGYVSKYLVCCVINDRINEADKFIIMGWIETSQVEEGVKSGRYRLNTLKAIYSPAYEILVKDLKDIDLLLPRFLQKPF